MVMRDFAVDMVENVSLRNAVSSMSTEPSEDVTTTSEEVTVQGCKGTPREGELSSAVVGKDRVGVLKESNQDEPVVHPSFFKISSPKLKTWSLNVPKIRDKVSAENLEETKAVDRCSNCGSPNEDTNIGHDNLAIMVGREHDGGGIEI